MQALPVFDGTTKAKLTEAALNSILFVLGVEIARLGM